MLQLASALQAAQQLPGSGDAWPPECAGNWSISEVNVQLADGGGAGLGGAGGLGGGGPASSALEGSQAPFLLSWLTGCCKVLLPRR